VLVRDRARSSSSRAVATDRWWAEFRLNLAFESELAVPPFEARESPPPPTSTLLGVLVPVPYVLAYTSRFDGVLEALWALCCAEAAPDMTSAAAARLTNVFIFHLLDISVRR